MEPVETDQLHISSMNQEDLGDLNCFRIIATFEGVPMRYAVIGGKNSLVELLEAATS